MGIESSKKTKENAKQEISHVESFVVYMYDGDSDPPANLLFLDDQPKIMKWLKEIRSKFKVTTCRHYIMDVRKFLLFLLEDQPAHLRLKQRQLRTINKTMKEQLKTLGREITLVIRVI